MGVPVCVLITSFHHRSLRDVNLGDTHVHAVAVGSEKVAHDVGLRAQEGWGERHP